MNRGVDLSVCIVNWNSRDLIQSCLRCLYGNIGLNRFEVLVVDNHSSDNSAEIIRREFPAVNLILNTENVGFARANNQMLGLARGEYALLLNSDTEVLKDSIPRMVAFMDANPAAGACGPKLLNRDLTYQRSFMDFPSLSYEFRYHLRYQFPPFGRMFKGILDYEKALREQEKIETATRVNVIPGASFLVRMATYRDIGPMGEEYFLYSEENDWCWRMRKRKWEVYYLPSATIVHLGGQSTKKAGEGTRVYNFYLSRHKFFCKYRRRNAYLTLRGIHLFFLGWSFLAELVGFLFLAGGKGRRRKIKLYRELMGMCIVGAG